MEKAYLHLLKYALRAGLRVDVFDEEELFKDLGYKEAKEVMESVENPEMIFYNGSERVGWASIIWGWDMAPDETVADWTVTRFMSRWANNYDPSVFDYDPNDPDFN